ncbi:MAG: zinc ribbon domain-containing protein [Candidatus Pacearchaeota archaeon]
MFNKKRCSNCNEKLDSDYNFCPYCRTPTKGKNINEDWGMLGKNDFDQNNGEIFPRGLNTLFNSLFSNLSEQMDKQLREMGKLKDQKQRKEKKRGIGISIHTSNGKPPEIRVTSFGGPVSNFKSKKNTKKNKSSVLELPSANAKKFLGLPKEEPKTEIRRLSDKVIYELKLPGVKSLKDISISRLENSIEIKALGKNKVFQKIITLNLPIKKYKFLKKKLVLELDAD